VRYLGGLYGHLDRELERLGRHAWFDDEIDNLTDPALYQPDPKNACRRVRGQRRIQNDAARGALEALAAWRECRAMTKNRPRRWIATDDTLIELANASPDTVEEMAGLAGTRGLLKAGCGNELVSMIDAGRERPRSVAPIAPSGADQRALVKRLAGILRQRAAELRLSPALLANRKQLERLARGDRDLPVLSGWRYAVIGEALLA
jgi:ribonuclease D